ncbi:hypothetical protein C9374_010311 [Naegleria lovaniensis]|uniref:Endonuclease/exonuclease/phosphatase domain-containing protein n=1 Tax=Naegleria lovaniensis TaxID=51637 RepID=A0AA88GG34_NAELO|nr:uncharacterized protein C9374_010311 [Naegleria lovaniensis]KAG2374937.1 hypothetical protein C9374_010311 [Naegleria lovaniensis]
MARGNPNIFEGHKTFHLLTYNTFLIHMLIGESPPYKSERVKGFLHQLNNDENQLDFVFFQELHRFGNVWFKLFDNSPYDEMLNGLIQKKIGQKLAFHVVESKKPFPLCQDSGLVILSKYPVLKSENYIFKSTTWRSYVTAKAFDENKRRLQIQELVQFIKECIEPFLHTTEAPPRIIISGDFNIDSIREEMYNEMMNLLNTEIGLCQDVFGSKVSEHPTTFAGVLCLDHVIVSGNFKAQLKL